MKKLFIFISCVVFLAFNMKAKDVFSPVMEGEIDGKEAVMQIVFHTEIDQDMESSVQGWFYFKSEGEKNKYDLTGWYGGTVKKAEIMFYVSKGNTDTGEMNGTYNESKNSGGAKTGEFAGSYKLTDGKELKFKFKNK